MKGKVLVRLLYRIPVCLSAKAAKQKIFASDDVLSSSITSIGFWKWLDVGNQAIGR
jgi:hypothetical protein